MRVEYDDALGLLRDAGAEVDPDTQIVKFPQYLVEESIRKAPRTVLFAGREKKYDLKLQGKRINFGLGGGATSFLDPESNTCRPSVRARDE